MFTFQHANRASALIPSTNRKHMAY